MRLTPTITIVLAAFCSAGGAFAQSAGWTESNGTTSTQNKVTVGPTAVSSKIFTVKAISAPTTTGLFSNLSSLGNNVFLLDAWDSGLNTRSAIAARFATGDGLPAAMIFSREGTGWGTSFGFFTHPDDTNVPVDQMEERFHITPNGKVVIRAINHNTKNTVFNIASLGDKVLNFDVSYSDLNEKTGIVANFSPTGIPAAMVLGREGYGWGTSVGFYTHGNETDFSQIDYMTERMHIGANGFVGIGANLVAPREMLEVQGNVYTQGNITSAGIIKGQNVIAQYQDIAEWVPADGDLHPGTVVVIDPARENAVVPSNRAYDTAVAGVVSAQPGVVLGEEGPSKERVATTGRVKVKADATHAPIRVGDLLVTSDVAGTAMRSDPVEIGGATLHRPGTVIGKALQPLASGRGEILVLLSLQ